MNSLTETARSWLTRIGIVGAVGVAAVAAVFLSAIFFALFAVVALVGGGWLWWQTRRLRQEADAFEHEYAQQRQQAEPPPQQYLEADYQVLDIDDRSEADNRLRKR